MPDRKAIRKNDGLDHMRDTLGRLRPRKACKRCRKNKSKCEPSDQGIHPCWSCARADVECDMFYEDPCGRGGKTTESKANQVTTAHNRQQGRNRLPIPPADPEPRPVGALAQGYSTDQIQPWDSFAVAGASAGAGAGAGAGGASGVSSAADSSRWSSPLEGLGSDETARAASMFECAAGVGCDSDGSQPAPMTFGYGFDHGGGHVWNPGDFGAIPAIDMSLFCAQQQYNGMQLPPEPVMQPQQIQPSDAWYFQAASMGPPPFPSSDVRLGWSRPREQMELGGH